MSLWKGENANYYTIHRWMRDKFGTPKICEFEDDTCNGRFEWANKSQNYSRRRDDWMRLCRSHHQRFDGRQRGANGQFIKQGSIRGRYANT